MSTKVLDTRVVSIFNGCLPLLRFHVSAYGHRPACAITLTTRCASLGFRVSTAYFIAGFNGKLPRTETAASSPSPLIYKPTLHTECFHFPPYFVFPLFPFLSFFYWIYTHYYYLFYFTFIFFSLSFLFFSFSF